MFGAQVWAQTIVNDCVVTPGLLPQFCVEHLTNRPLKNTVHPMADVIEFTPRAIGRPSTYDPKYCEQIIAHCEQGLSVETFAASIGVHRSVVEGWVRVHEEFSKAKDIARDKHRLFYERCLATAAIKGEQNTVASWMLERTQRQDYGRDPNINLHTHNNGVTNNVVDVKVLSLEAQKALAKELMKKRELLNDQA